MKRLLTAIMVAAAMSCNTTENKKISTPAAMDETIELTAPEKNGATLLDALEKRASVREYSDRMPSLEQLSGVLWAACGINRPLSGKRTAPSALALYPVRVYAFFEEGTYLDEPENNSLRRIMTGDSRNLAGLQDFVFSAPLNLLYVADLDVYKTMDIPTEKGFVLASLDAAGYAQNVNLYCAACGMASITRASFPAEKALDALELNAGRFAVVLAQTVGFER